MTSFCARSDILVKISLSDNILDLYHYTGSHMTDPIQKDRKTVTDINSFQLPIVIARLTPEQVSRLRRDPNVEQVAPDGVAYRGAARCSTRIVIYQNIRR